MKEEDPEFDPNPSYGKKGGFRKVTVTVPQRIYERLIQESARRKIAGAPNQMLSALFREALSLYLEQLG
jgi:transcriptional regulator of met regulon